MVVFPFVVALFLDLDIDLVFGVVLMLLLVGVVLDLSPRNFAAVDGNILKLHPEVLPSGCRPPDLPLGRTDGDPILWCILDICVELFSGLQTLGGIPSF